MKILEINESQIIKNINEFEKKIPVMAVVKANAYGVGVENIVPILEKAGINFYAVYSYSEAVEVRKLSNNSKILILGDTTANEKMAAYENDFSVSIFSFNGLMDVSKRQPIHLKIDTGMGRTGFLRDDIIKLSKIAVDYNVEGIYSHFASSDTSKKVSKEQIINFDESLKLLRQKPKYIHISNTNGLAYNYSRANIGRVGIGIYGISDFRKVKLALSLKIKAIQVKKHYTGPVSYQQKYFSKNETIITFPIGYADGLENAKQKVYNINSGKKYKTVGNICMDQCMVKADEDARITDVYELFGKNISLERYSKNNNISVYKSLTSLGSRIERKIK